MAEQPISVTVHGTEQFAVGCERLVGRIDRAADDKFRGVADQVAIVVRARVPVVSGRLRGSVEATDRHGDIGVSMGSGSVPYAGWIEFGGTRGRPYMPEGRYLYPAAENATPELKRAGETACREQIGVMVWPKPR